MRSDLLQLAASLDRDGEAFAVATVVRREPASSAQVGNTALITESGEFHGWLGGSCIRPTVMREAASVIETATPRLISLSPDPSAEQRPGVDAQLMTCHSGGSVDIYIEAVIPAPRLLVFGVSPTAHALVRLAKVMGYRVEAVDPDASDSVFPEADRVLSEFRADEFRKRPRSQRARLFAVVATIGERDTSAIREALAADPAYVGLVASRRRFAEMGDALAPEVGREALGRISNPAGLDIGAKSPEEVALSILAEIVQVRRAPTPQSKGAASSASRPAMLVMHQPAPAETHASGQERDPICGMSVTVATARHRAEHGGRTYYFCCGGCREKFLAAPERYVEAAAARD